MISIRSVAFLLLLPAYQCWAQDVPAPGAAGGKTQVASPISVVSVSCETALIEEKTLAPWSGFEGKRLPVLSAPDEVESRSNAVRLYGFTLKSNEQLHLKLECENSGKIVMKFVLPPTPGLMAAQYKKANITPRALRCSRISIQNVTDQPYPVILSLMGQANYPYRLMIERR